jgi:uncharacterized protein YciI
MRIAYFYLMRDEQDRVHAVAPDHAAYWRDLRVPGYVGGPLADRSGGLITFEAESMQVAEELVANDPFVRADLHERAWVKEWDLAATEPVAPDLRPVGRARRPMT